MSESNKPAGDKPLVRTESRNVVDILIDELGGTTVRPPPSERPPRPTAPVPARTRPLGHAARPVLSDPEQRRWTPQPAPSPSP